MVSWEDKVLKSQGGIGSNLFDHLSPITEPFFTLHSSMYRQKEKLGDFHF